MKRIKLFETFDKSEYYRLLTPSERDPTSNEYYNDVKHPLFAFDYNSIKKIVSLFNNSDWKIYIEKDPFMGVEKWDIHIIPSDKGLDWLCWDKKERKKFEKYYDDPKKIVKSICIHSVRGYQIYNYDDDYYQLSVNDSWGNSLEEWECDQLDGLIKLIKDKGLLKLN